MLFFAIFQKETTSITFSLLPMAINSSEYGPANLLVQKYFSPLRVEPTENGDKKENKEFLQ